MSELLPTDIPKEWLEAEYETIGVGAIVNKLERGNSPLPAELTDSVSRKTVARAMCLYGIFGENEKYKRESWLRSLYQDNRANPDGYASINDLTEVVVQSDNLRRTPSMGTWLDTYDIPKGPQTNHDIPQSDKFDRDYFVQRYREDGLSLDDLTAELNEKTPDNTNICTSTVREHLDWLGIDIRTSGPEPEDRGVPIEQFGSIVDADRYRLNHHYRVRPVSEAAPVSLEYRDRREEWLEATDHLTHWTGTLTLPDASILYAPDALAEGTTPPLADKFESYRETEAPIKNLSEDIGVAPPAVELALVFYGIRGELQFVTIEDRSVVDDVSRGRSELLTSRGAFAVLRLFYELEPREIADHLNVCEGLVKFAERVHDLPIETAVGRDSNGYRGELHDPRYLRAQLDRMGVAGLAAEHDYESTTTVERLLNAFELDRPTTIAVPELACSVRSIPEKHVGTWLAELAAEHPDLTVGYETTEITLDLSAFDCPKDTKQYIPDFTVKTAHGVFYIEVKGRVDNGELHDHLLTDRQKAKAMMDALSDRDDKEYVVITNGADLKYYDYEFAFVEDFELNNQFDNRNFFVENENNLRELLHI